MQEAHQHAEQHDEQRRVHRGGHLEASARAGARRGGESSRSDALCTQEETTLHNVSLNLSFCSQTVSISCSLLEN